MSLHLVLLHYLDLLVMLHLQLLLSLLTAQALRFHHLNLQMNQLG